MSRLRGRETGGWRLRVGYCALVAMVAMLPEPAFGDLAKGPVTGTIRFQGGPPAAGIRVVAWDYDGMGDLDKNDFIGDAITDATGAYTIQIEGKHWDPAPHNVTTWRPDIIVVAFRNVGGEWVRVAKSKTYDNKPHREALRVDLGIPPDRWIESSTTFKPDVHGWPFRNREFPITWKGVDHDWSLCGGMSLTALARWRNGIPITPDVPPTSGTLEILKNAQLETLNEWVWSQFVEYTQSPDLPHTLAYNTIGYKTEQQVPKVRSSIDNRIPIILGLIYVGPSNLADSVFHNHQVLAIGYRFNDATGEAHIAVYDPNYPGTTSEISLHTRLRNNRIKARQHTPGFDDLKVRGFFVIPEASLAVSGRPQGKPVVVRRKN